MGEHSTLEWIGAAILIGGPYVAIYTAVLIAKWRDTSPPLPPARIGPPRGTPREVSSGLGADYGDGGGGG